MNRLRRILRQFRDGWSVSRTSDIFEFLRGWGRHELLARQPEYQMKTSWTAFPITLRRGSSDAMVFLQIFVLREYAPLDGLPDVELVIDCGANIGCSAAYFLSRFPKARVIAVESDPSNYALLSRNLAPYGERAHAMHAAVWPHDGWVHSHTSPYRDGREWTRQVRALETEESGDVRAVSLRSLINEGSGARVSLLKMDIEGAEVPVFRESPPTWLENIDALAVELHDDTSFGPATPVFAQAMKGQPFSIITQGELTICRRLGESRGAASANNSGRSV